jgi:hypothetical protein
MEKPFRFHINIELDIVPIKTIDLELPILLVTKRRLDE